MGETLRVADVEHIPTDRLIQLVTDSFDNLVTVALSEATNGCVPRRTRRLEYKRYVRQITQVVRGRERESPRAIALPKPRQQPPDALLKNTRPSTP